MGDGRSGPDKRSPADTHGGNQLGVTADEDIVHDLRFVFFLPIIIAGDGPGTDIDILSHHGISQVAQVGCLCPSPYDRFFNLDEVAYPGR